MNTFIDHFIMRLDEQFMRGAAPKISVEPLGGLDVFMKKYKIIMMNCFLNSLLSLKKIPKEPFNIAVLVTSEGEVIIRVEPDVLLNGLNEARQEFERFEYFEKAAVCRDYIDLIIE